MHDSLPYGVTGPLQPRTVGKGDGASLPQTAGMINIGFRSATYFVNFANFRAQRFD